MNCYYYRMRQSFTILRQNLVWVVSISLQTGKGDQIYSYFKHKNIFCKLTFQGCEINDNIILQIKLIPFTSCYLCAFLRYTWHVWASKILLCAHFFCLTYSRVYVWCKCVLHSVLVVAGQFYNWNSNRYTYSPMYCMQSQDVNMASQCYCYNENIFERLNF